MSVITALDPSQLSVLTTGIVSAYVSHHHMPPTEVPGLIIAVHGALASLATGASPLPAEETVERLSPAQIRKSITPDALISFLDGKPYKTLKRHLTKHELHPASYRARFGLPADYPMVAPNYSALRSSYAQQLGLGRKLGTPDDDAPPAKSSKRPARNAA